MSVMEVVKGRCVADRVGEMRGQFERLLPLFKAEAGCLGASGFMGIEEPDSFILLIEWDSVEAHLTWKDSGTDFRTEWSNSIRPLFSGKNDTAHFEKVASS